MGGLPSGLEAADIWVPAAMADWVPGGLAHPAQRVAGRTLRWRGSQLEPKGA